MEQNDLKEELELPYVFPLDKVPAKILNHELSESDQQRLARGLYTGLISDLHTKNGVKDAKVKLVPDANGKDFKLSFQYKEQQLEIPSKIGSKKIKDKDKEVLQSGKPLSIAKNIFLQVDRELNKVVVTTSRDFNIPSHIAGYQLSNEDIKKLADGKQMATKVFKGKSGYFMAEVAVVKSEGKMGLEWSNIKQISADKAKDLIKEYNTHPEKDIDIVADITELSQQAMQTNDKTLGQDIKQDSAIEDITEISQRSFAEKEIEETLEKIQPGFDFTYNGKEYIVLNPNLQDNHITLFDVAENKEIAYTAHQVSDMLQESNEKSIDFAKGKDGQQGQEIEKEKHPEIEAIKRKINLDFNSLSDTYYKLHKQASQPDVSLFDLETLRDVASHLDKIDLFSNITQTIAPFISENDIKELKTAFQAGDIDRAQNLRSKYEPQINQSISQEKDNSQSISTDQTDKSKSTADKALEKQGVPFDRNDYPAGIDPSSF